MRQIRRNVICNENFPEFHVKIFNWLIKNGCESPKDSFFRGAVYSNVICLKKQRCFNFSSKMLDRYRGSIDIVTHFLLSKEGCKGEEVICVITSNYLDIYKHSFYKHKVGKCPYCEYRFE